MMPLRLGAGGAAELVPPLPYRALYGLGQAPDAASTIDHSLRPAARNLTPGEGSAVPRFADAQALGTMLRQGKRPGGTAIAVRPFDSFKHIADTDVAALHLNLKSLPPRPAGAR